MQSLSGPEMRRDPRYVFVVHGRNLRVRDAVFEILTAFGLVPLEWERAVALTGSSSPYIGEILDAAFKHAQAVVVILSGDDEVRLRSEFVSTSDPAYERELFPQARPNVLFEAGMALGHCPDRTILLQIGEVRPFSDIAGRHVLRFGGSPEERHTLRERLRRAGCHVDDASSRWLTAGSDAFRPAHEARRTLDLVRDNPKVLSE